jgi:hypothetical protein
VQGRVNREVRADGTTDVLYAYESSIGRLHTLTDPEDQVKTYAYALDDRLLSVSYTNENLSTPHVTFTYDSTYPRTATMVDGIDISRGSCPGTGYQLLESANPPKVSGTDSPRN